MSISVVNFSRRDLRSLIIQILYAIDLNNYELSVNQIIIMFNAGYELDIPIDGEIYTIVSGIVSNRDDLDTLLQSLLVNWQLDRVGCCTRLILRIALWELQNTKTHNTIIINEAIELAKNFSEKDAHRFVNGVLDEAIKKHHFNYESVVIE